jgi:hypothetical protein
MTRSTATKSIARLGLVALLVVPAAFAVGTPHAHHQASKPRFSITGGARRLLYPGAKPTVIALRLRNPNHVPILVMHVRVTLRGRDFPPGCSRSAFLIKQAVLPRRGVKVPSNGSVTLPAWRAPTIRMLSTGNQDWCSRLRLAFRYAGRAHS